MRVTVFRIPLLAAFVVQYLLGQFTEVGARHHRMCQQCACLQLVAKVTGIGMPQLVATHVNLGIVSWQLDQDACHNRVGYS